MSDCGGGLPLNSIFEKDDKLRKLRSRIVFDVVSCQFAIHYFFESEKRLRSYLSNVTDRLEEGGCFIGTTIDSDRLVHLIRQKDDLTFQNDYIKIVFG